MRIEELTQVIGLTVTGQRVLGQVVGANREEIHFLGQFVGNQNRGRSFDHDTDLGVFVVRNAFLLQLCHDALAGTLALLDLPDGGNHGEHDGDLTKSGGPI